MLLMRGRDPQALWCAHQSLLCVCVCGPGVGFLYEFEKVLEVLWSSDDDGLRGGDGANRLVFRLHHTLYKTQPVKLPTGGRRHGHTLHFVLV